MTDQPALFQVDTTTTSQCPVCGAVRAAGDDKAPACAYDAHRDGKRPRGCLNAHRPEHADIPF